MKIKDLQLLKIEKYLNNKKIISSKLLSDSFGINCIKIATEDKKNYIIKYYKKNNYKFNAIKSEYENLNYLNGLNLKFFPIAYPADKDHLIISFIENDKSQPKESKDDFVNAIINMHSNKNDKFGFNFNTQIGGLKQINIKTDNWIEFYKKNRLNYIYELICSTNPMEKLINSKIEKLLNKLEDFIPKNPIPTLLHGDLWEGNILFNKKKFVGLIDPGSFFGHNEFEIAYLTWFNPGFIKNNFLDKYNEVIRIDREYHTYEPVYQLYYSLMNVHLWDRKYINDAKRLLEKIKI